MRMPGRPLTLTHSLSSIPPAHPSIMVNNKQRPRLVVMVPLRRCGSHALRLRLNASPDFYAPYPLHVVDFLPILPLYGDLEDDKNFFRLVVDVVGLQAASPVKWPGISFDPVEIFDCVKDARPRSIHRIVGELLLRMGEAQGAKVVLDKSLDSVHEAEELIECFPDVHFLHVSRDPRAQVNSMNKSIIHDFDTHLNALTWREAHDAGAALAAKHPGRVLSIRFEDFIQDEEQTLRRVCDFLGLRFVPAMLGAVADPQVVAFSKRSALWENNCRRPMPAVMTKYRAAMLAAEIALVEAIAGKHMARLGYAPSASAEEAAAAAALADDPAALAAARERSAAGKAKAWAALKEEHYQDWALRVFRSDYIKDCERRQAREREAARG